MKFLIAFCFFFVLRIEGFTSAGTIKLVDSKISILGQAQMKFDSPGGMWAGLSAGKSIPTQAASSSSMCLSFFSFFSGLRICISFFFSPARRFPIIYSGDLIALRVATTKGSATKWLSGSKTTFCGTSTCPAADYMTAAKWAACPTVVFRIRARGKADGEPVDSGDRVKISFPYYGETRFFYCSTSTTYQCRA